MSAVAPISGINSAVRRFAFTISLAAMVVFGVFLPWLSSHKVPIWPWMTGSVLVVWALIHPVSLAPVYRGWMKIAEILGEVNNRILLGIIFFVVFVPTGRLRRLFGGDPLALRPDKAARSYRVSMERRLNDMERLF
jgi:hypothetical protein